MFVTKVSIAPSSRNVDYNYQIKVEDLTPYEIKTDGVPGALARRQREKRDVPLTFTLLLLLFTETAVLPRK